MRPKSIATVVDVLPVLVPPVSSIPSATLVIAASVVSGAISEMEPTKVVFPTANPPATMILTGSGAGAVGAVASAVVSEGLEAIEDPFEQLAVRTVAGPGGVWGGGGEQTLLDHVAHEDADHTEGQVEVGGDLGDRDAADALGDDVPALEGEARKRRSSLGRHPDERLEREVGAASGATAGEHVRADAQARRGAVGSHGRARRGHRGSAPWSSARISGVSTPPARSTSTAIS